MRRGAIHREKFGKIDLLGEVANRNLRSSIYRLSESLRCGFILFDIFLFHPLCEIEEVLLLVLTRHQRL